MIIIAVIAIIAFIGCVLQILWIRKKLADYSQSQMAANLAKQAVELSVHSSNAQVYSLVVNAQLTRQLNNASNPDFINLQSIYAPMSFSLPQTCNGDFSTALISCNKIAFLVIEKNQSAANLTTDLMEGNIFYLMIKEVLYLAAYTPAAAAAAAATPAFQNNTIICLYTIKSAKNIPTVTGCNVGLIPFFGQTSTDSTPNIVSLLDIDSGTITFPLHALGILVTD